MALTPFTGTITASTLNSNFDDATITITQQREAGQKDQTFYLYLNSLAAGAALRDRSIAFVAPDNLFANVFFLRVTDGTASRVVTGTLTVDGGNSDFLGTTDFSLSLTTGVGTVDTRDSGQFNPGSSSAYALMIIKGVRYRLTMENTTAATTVSGPLLLELQCRSRRRIA